MKKILLIALLSSTTAFSQNVMNTYANNAWEGYINVFNSSGVYEFGFQPLLISELKTDLDLVNDLVILQPNFKLYEDNQTDPAWVDQTTGEGQKIIEANTIVQSFTDYNGQDLTFTGEVKEFTLSTDYTVKFFIKALDPNNGYQDVLNQSKVFDLPTSGAFSVSATAAELATGLLVQYGFAVTGKNANPTDEAILGNVVIGTLVCSEYVIDVATTTSGTTIEASATDVNYQWLDCDNDYAPINNATSQSFTASQNGNYAVEITDGICVDTSDCVAITTVSLVDYQNIDHVSVYPNPTKNTLYIDNANIYVSYKIVDIQGKVLRSDKIAGSINIEDLKQGHYFIHFTNDHSNTILKFIKI